MKATNVIPLSFQRRVAAKQARVQVSRAIRRLQVTEHVLEGLPDDEDLRVADLALEDSLGIIALAIESVDAARYAP